jgi:hypothetical protein
MAFTISLPQKQNHNKRTQRKVDDKTKNLHFIFPKFAPPPSFLLYIYIYTEAVMHQKEKEEVEINENRLNDS